MTKWNHRVLAHKSNEVEIYFQVHEVYYNDKGKPQYYTENAISIGGESYNEIQWQISKIQECLTLPVIDADNWPDEFKGNFTTKLKEQ
jgi:hypothetical protein